MRDLNSIYHSMIPEEFKQACKSPEMQRLKDVGMNCGCLYTSFEFFKKCDDYSRYQHSIGVGLITLHFSNDLKQGLAGLFHDIASPVFAHVIDFARGDYTNQEATEEGTSEMIAHSEILSKVIKECGYAISDVDDYHKYPVSDNDSPKLSADRLEYTLGNLVNYGFGTVEDVQEIYNDLVLGTNEFNENEIIFQNQEIASKFTKLMIQCAKIYIADMDRYSMEKLAQLVNRALKRNILTEKDLYTTETEVIHKLCSDEVSKAEWEDFCKTNKVMVDEKGQVIAAKKRYINAYVQHQGRICELDEECKRLITDFVNTDLSVKILEVKDEVRD